MKLRNCFWEILGDVREIDIVGNTFFGEKINIYRKGYF